MLILKVCRQGSTLNSYFKVLPIVVIWEQQRKSWQEGPILQFVLVRFIRKGETFSEHPASVKKKKKKNISKYAYKYQN
jgi:hypothetical protein